MLSLFGAQISNALGGPQPRHEWILARAIREENSRAPAHWTIGRLPVETHHCIPAPVIARQNHEILARKYVHRS